MRQSSQTPTPSSPSPQARDLLAEMTEEELLEDMNPRTPRWAHIDLDDVLHVAALDKLSDAANASEGTSNAGDSVRSRWDRVPINAFHRLRSASHSGVLGSPVNTTVTMTAASASPRAANGPTYGPSIMSPYAEYGAFRETHSPHSSPIRNKSVGARPRRNSLLNVGSKGRAFEKRKMLVSPVLLPAKEEGHDVEAFTLGSATPTPRRSPPANLKRASTAPHV